MTSRNRPGVFWLSPPGYARRSWAYASGCPFQQPPAKIVFEQLYLACDRRLGNVQALGGTAEAAFLKDHQEQSEFVDHGCNGDAKTASPQSPIGIIARDWPRSVWHMNNNQLLLLNNCWNG